MSFCLTTETLAEFYPFPYLLCPQKSLKVVETNCFTNKHTCEAKFILVLKKTSETLVLTWGPFKADRMRMCV